MDDRINFSTSLDLSIKHLFSNSEYSGHAILVDSNTEKYCLHLIPDRYLQNVISIPFGENSKSIEQCQYIWKKMTEMGMDRKSLLINLGGGMICDIGAFCASTFKRGIRFVHIPTSLLAMTDAAIGGKSGINFMSYKNHIGLFNPAEMIIINPIFLDTLPKDQLRSGYAEILKHGIIANKELWEMTHFKENSREDWENIIEISCSVKNDIVSKDFDEKGLRKSLNFGHSIGHLLESYHFEHKNQTKLHGDAIAQGMMVESFIAYQKYLLSEKDLAAICQRIQDIFDPEVLDDQTRDYILKNITQDKKNAFKKLLFALPEAIGKVTFDHEVKTDDIKMALSNYNDYLL